MIGGPPAWATKLVKPAMPESSVPLATLGEPGAWTLAAFSTFSRKKAMAMPPIIRPIIRSLSRPKLRVPISTPTRAPGSMIFRFRPSHLP
ncbi:hypothetical protein D9M70_639090 [compost metagenome]